MTRVSTLGCTGRKRGDQRMQLECGATIELATIHSDRGESTGVCADISTRAVEFRPAQ